MTYRICQITYFKYVLYFIFAFLSFLLFTGSTFAQTNPADTIYPPSYSNSYLPSQSPHTTSMALYNFGHALSCILMGQSPIAPCLEYKFVKDTTGMVKSVPYLSSVNSTGGLLGLGGSALDLVYTEKPLDQMSFFTYLGHNIGIIDEANAQVPGSGNQVLSPIFALWTVSRNIAYLTMILIFIGVGLMVMFRQKLNPQTVVSVQMALPGLVIGLILITFSYFLSALITDMAYVGTDIVGYYFDQAVRANGGRAASQPLSQALEDKNLLSVGADATFILDEDTMSNLVGKFYSYLPDEGKILPGTFGQILLSPKRVVSLFSAAMTYMFYNTMLSPVADIFSGAIGLGGAAAGGLSSFAGKWIPAASGWGSKIGSGVSIFGTLFGGGGTTVAAVYAREAYNDPAFWLSFWGTILAIVIMLYTLVRLFFKLISSYLMIIFLTISSPFVFLASSIPGRQGMALSWMRNMLCHVLAFPAVIGVFYFAAFLLGNDQIKVFGVNAPLNLTATTHSLPFLGGLDLGFLRKALAFMAILTTPSIPDAICRSVGKPSQSGALLAGAIGGAIGAGRQYEGQITGQIQKGAQDVGTWKQSLLGTTPYSGGRIGRLQLQMHKFATGSEPTASDGLSHDYDAMKWYSPRKWAEAVRRGIGGPYAPGDKNKQGKAF